MWEHERRDEVSTNASSQSCIGLQAAVGTDLDPSEACAGDVILAAVLSQLYSWVQDLLFTTASFALALRGYEKTLDPATNLPKQNFKNPWPGRPSREFLFHDRMTDEALIITAVEQTKIDQRAIEEGVESAENEMEAGLANAAHFEPVRASVRA